MKSNRDIIESLPAEIVEGFNWEATVGMVLDIVRRCILRKDFARGASYLTTLNFLGVELEEMGFSDLEMNLLARHL